MIKSSETDGSGQGHAWHAQVMFIIVRAAFAQCSIVESFHWKGTMGMQGFR